MTSRKFWFNDSWRALDEKRVGKKEISAHEINVKQMQKEACKKDKAAQNPETNKKKRTIFQRSPFSQVKGRLKPVN